MITTRWHFAAILAAASARRAVAADLLQALRHDHPRIVKDAAASLVSANWRIKISLIRIAAG